MGKVHEARLKLRGELEASPALRRFGSGWISGVIGLVLGLGGLLLVISLRAPGLFAVPELRGFQGSSWLRLALHVLLLAVLPLTGIRAWVRSLPFAIQLLAIMFLTDLMQYWVHRAIHRVPWLWRFHAVHHSARSMDWMASARMHFLEIFALRAATVIPMFCLGFSELAMHS